MPGRRRRRFHVKEEAASTTRDSRVNVKQLFDLTGRVAIVTGGSI